MPPLVVTTVNGNRYRLADELGRGGQGAVFGVDGGRYAVKLLRDRSERAREALRDRLAMVKRLPLEDLPLARPQEQLRAPHLGYVMDLYTGMAPLQTMLRPPKDSPSLARWYLDGGGLRRRLRLLARTADLFSVLHGRGLVYTDPSPQNIFISAVADAQEVRLIDTDNLRASSVIGQTFFTPGYGAPELNSNTGSASSLSDAHAFSVIAFQTLALVHPLKGDLVDDGEPELEEQALNGNLPWIDEPGEDCNRSSKGVPREVVLSRNLREDFAQAFGDGLKDPLSRPGMSRWAEHLHRAADNTLSCVQCGASFYRTSDVCPWCEAVRPGYVSLDCVLWDPGRTRLDDQNSVPVVEPGTIRKIAEVSERKERGIDSAVVCLGESIDLTDRFTAGENSGKPQLRVRYDGSDLVIAALEAGPWRLVSIDGRGDRRLDGGRAHVPVGNGRVDWFLRTGNSDRLHRIMRFRYVKAGKK